MVDSMTGCLYLVSTPIGNLGDMTPRAQEVLQNVDIICAEDTRHTIKLLKHFSINTKCISLHDHNEVQRLDQLEQMIREGQNLALVSDAGTPLVSDPGYKLVRALEPVASQIIPIPGASAVSAALVASGLPTDRYTFFGFSPAKANARRRWFQETSQYNGTLVFFESKHRLIDALQDMRSIFGDDILACVAREITKEYETFYRGTLQSIHEHLCGLERHLGEFVVLVSNPAKAATSVEELASQPIPFTLEEILSLMQAPPTKKVLSAKISDKISGSKQEWYKLIHQMSQAVADDGDDTSE